MEQRKLRVGLDHRPLEDGFKAHAGRGTGRYAAEVTRELGELLSNDEVASTIDLVHCTSKGLGQSALERSLYKYLPYGRHTIEQQLLLPRRIDSVELDLFHFFSHVDAPTRGRTPYLLSVLDLIPMKFADLYRADKPGWRFRLARYLESEAIRRARGIIAISEATKRDIIELLNIRPARIMVTPLGVGEAFLKADKTTRKSTLRKGFSIPEDRPLLLYIGGIDARKNVGFLIEIFGALCLRCVDASKRPVLAIAGKYEDDEHFPELREKIRQRGVEDDVKLLGFVAEAGLQNLYLAADIFVFPSLYEGFGLPLLEAMACGVPVVAGNNSSIPEVAGEAAKLLPDNDLAIWVETIEGLLTNDGARQTLAEQGVARAKRFSWKRTAEETLNAYRYFATC